MIIIDKELVKAIRWENHPDSYDQQLYRLGWGYDEFYILNPDWPEWALSYINKDIDTDSCVVWYQGNSWIAKRFRRGWEPSKGWLSLEVNIKVEGEPEFEFNPDLPEIDYPIQYDPKDWDARRQQVWFLDRKFFPGQDIWVARAQYPGRETIGQRHMGYVSPALDTEFDVVFISYNEPNAEANWAKVRERCDRAYRINGVKGIFQAHKCAAEVAQTDMVWIVDADADLADDWQFDYVPDIFNRDCIHVWHSRNPVNDLEYGYGGVKLFPRKLLLEAEQWSVDMTTSIGGKLKIINRVSNTTAFNTDEFSTWRSAFRECAKLSAGAIKNQNEVETKMRLDTWMTSDLDRPFSDWAKKGARAGYLFGYQNRFNKEQLKNINDREWLKARFDEKEI